MLGGTTAAWSFAALAQQTEQVREIGVLMLIEQNLEGRSRLSAFRQGLEQLGWTEGRNVRIDERWAAGDPDRARSYAAELANLRPDVILANGVGSVAALRGKAESIPIVFVQVADPVGAGLVPNLSHPGGNITGFAHYDYTFAAKWLELLTEVAPRTAHLLILDDASDPAWSGFSAAIRSASSSRGLAVSAIPARDGAEIESRMSDVGATPKAALIVLPSALTGVQRDLIVTLAARYRLPAIYPYRYFVAIGGLMCYAIEVNDQYRRAAAYVDRILRGEKPGGLPVQAPVKFELVINLNTAKTLGLAIPLSLLARADDVIE
jgi:putative ABC transport system substrate-binding protein